MTTPQTKNNIKNLKNNYVLFAFCKNKNYFLFDLKKIKKEK
jgi:hypothetical protein